MTTTDWKGLFKEAAEIAASVPESMQQAAFNRALDLLLQQRGVSAPEVRREQPKPQSRRGRPPGEGGRIDRLMETLDRTRYPGVMGATKVLDRALLVLGAAREHEVDGLTAHEIGSILTDKFRVTTKDSAVRMALGKAGDKVDRTRSGSAFVYRLMAPGEAYLQSLGSAPGTPTPTVGRRPRRSRRRASKPAPAKAGGSDEARPRRSDGRPGPKTVVEGLIGTGFFSDGRTMAAIQEHVEKAQGRRYKATDLSPALVRLLREKKLTREKNAEGQYEYKSP